MASIESDQPRVGFVIPVEANYTAEGTEVKLIAVASDEETMGIIEGDLTAIGATKANKGDGLTSGSSFGFSNWNGSSWQPQGPRREWMGSEPPVDPRNN